MLGAPLEQGSEDRPGDAAATSLRDDLQGVEAEPVAVEARVPDAARGADLTA